MQEKHVIVFYEEMLQLPVYLNIDELKNMHIHSYASKKIIWHNMA